MCIIVQNRKLLLGGLCTDNDNNANSSSNNNNNDANINNTQRTKHDAKALWVLDQMNHKVYYEYWELYGYTGKLDGLRVNSPLRAELRSLNDDIYGHAHWAQMIQFNLVKDITVVSFPCSIKDSFLGPSNFNVAI